MAMAENEKAENPAETAGTVAGRAATIIPRKNDEEASPGAEADKKQAEQEE